MALPRRLFFKPAIAVYPNSSATRAGCSGTFNGCFGSGSAPWPTGADRPRAAGHGTACGNVFVPENAVPSRKIEYISGLLLEIAMAQPSPTPNAAGGGKAGPVSPFRSVKSVQ